MVNPYFGNISLHMVSTFCVTGVHNSNVKGVNGHGQVGIKMTGSYPTVFEIFYAVWM